MQYVLRALKKLEMCYKNVGWGAPPGHFYSPVNAIDDLKRRYATIWPEVLPKEIAAVDLNQQGQLAMLNELLPFYREICYLNPSQHANLRYYFPNEFFPIADASMLQCMIRRFSPQRVIEVGSGFSSMVMLDTNQLYMKNAVQLTFIDPNPERLYGLLREEDKAVCRIEAQGVQTVPMALFEQLKKNDILFIDTSHVSKTASDVNYIFFEILPRLASGVVIHLHDIFWPFEYLPDWILEKRMSYNEIYLLRAFLMHNKEYRVILFGHFSIHQFQDWYQTHLPRMAGEVGGSLWLQKA